MGTAPALRTALHVATVIGASVLIAVIIWLDVTTTIWQEMVILSGLAAGLVSFLLTTVFVNRLLRRQLEARWEPVTHMALTAILHGLADDEHSDLSRGRIISRTLSLPATREGPALATELERVREEVLRERDHLSGVLGTWSHFLTSTGDNTEILRAAADLALRFDQVRDAALHTESLVPATDDHAAALDEVSSVIRACNEQQAALIGALQTRLGEHISSGKRRA